VKNAALRGSGEKDGHVARCHVVGPRPESAAPWGECARIWTVQHREGLRPEGWWSVIRPFRRCLDIRWNASPAIMLSPTLPVNAAIRGGSPWGDETMLSAVVPARANGGSDTRGTDNQPEGRGRPRVRPTRCLLPLSRCTSRLQRISGVLPTRIWIRYRAAIVSKAS
jgi:hypothetical protein